jgi:uncharacterized membrane protein YdbT with pleckstrin-like domain
MASYVDSVLMTGEQVVHSGKVSILSMLPAFIGGGFLSLMGLMSLVASLGDRGLIWLLLGGLWIGVGLVRRLTTELAVTNKRLIAKTGLVSRSTVELNLTKVESVRVQQSILGRMLGYGSIVVGGTGATHAPVPYIDDPMTFKRAVTAAADAVQSH